MSSETKESAGYIEILAWLETHKQKLIMGGSGALVVGFVIFFANWRSDQTEVRASGALYEIRVNESTAEEGEETDPRDYLTVAEDFSGTSAAQRAILFAAETYFTQGNYAKAEEEFNRFKQQWSDHEFASTAVFGIAASLDAQEKKTEAAAAYRSVITGYPNSPVANQAKLSLAGLHEDQNEIKEALDLYDELNRPGVYSSFSSLAATRRTKLLEKHPELDTSATTSAVEPDSASLPAPLINLSEAEATATTSTEGSVGDSTQPESTADETSGEPAASGEPETPEGATKG